MGSRKANTTAVDDCGCSWEAKFRLFLNKLLKEAGDSAKSAEIVVTGPKPQRVTFPTYTWPGILCQVRNRDSRSRYLRVLFALTLD